MPSTTAPTAIHAPPTPKHIEATMNPATATHPSVISTDNRNASPRDSPLTAASSRRLAPRRGFGCQLIHPHIPETATSHALAAIGSASHDYPTRERPARTAASQPRP